MDNQLKVSLTKEEVSQLNLFLGFGDFTNTDILFFGQEEGLGPDQPQLDMAQKHKGEVELRINYIRKHSSTAYLNKYDSSLGYWITGNDADKLRNLCYQDIGYEVRKEDQKRRCSLRQTWSYPARIQSALEENNTAEMWKWFERNPSVSEKLRVRIERGLYGNSNGVRFSLTDWRPIPHQNLDPKWPFSGEIDFKQYEDAFYFKIVPDSFYSDLREKRIHAYRELFNTYHIPIVYCYGAKLQNERIKVFKEIAGDCNFEIKEAAISPKTKNKIKWVDIKFGSGRTTVIFTNQFTNGAMSLDELECVTKQIKRVLDGQSINLNYQ